MDKFILGEKYHIKFKVARIIKEYDDSYFKISRVNIIDFEPHNPMNKLPLAATETLYTSIPSLIEGNTYRAEVQTVESQKYGLNLQVIGAIELIEPTNENEYKAFLQNSFKGIGPAYSSKLVEVFGLGALENVIHNERALPLAGVPNSVAEQVKETAVEMVDLNNLINFFNEFNIPVQIATDIHKVLGDSAKEQIQSNPWVMSSVDYNFFSYADKIAVALGFPSNINNRISSAILSYIKYRMNSGHMAILEEELYSYPFRDWLSWVGKYSNSKNQSITNEEVQNELDMLRDIWVLETPTNKDGERMVYFRTVLQMEENIILGMSNFLNIKSRTAIASTLEPDIYLDALKNGEFLTEEDKELGIEPFTPAEEQEDAIRMALTKPFSIITGGPGTGKTTVVNTIVQAIEYLRHGASIAMLAPTGKASKRMAEITKRPASTIHRKLKLKIVEDEDEIVTIEDDYVIIDESSMVDANLFNKFINNLSPRTSVLLVGDVNQLPSVGSGAILRDFIDSGVIPTTRLLKVFRQAEESAIVSNSYKLNSGVLSEEMTFEPHSEMVFHEYPNEHHMQKLIVKYVDYLQTKMNLSDIAVLSPMRKGLLGVDELNKQLQEKINPKTTYKQQILYNQKREIYLREGDTVMQTANDKDKDISNGETGVISAIYEDIVEMDDGKELRTTCVEVIYEDSYMGERELIYTAQEARDQLELAYAITIHKSQGSEYKAVIIPFTGEHKVMLKRNLIYTAWTRAKEMVINIGEKKWVDYAAENNDNVLRYSQIKEKLVALVD